MEKVGLREANIHFAKYVKKVKEGTEVMLTDRGKPIAIISPISRRDDPIEERLDQLERKGILKRASAGKLKLHNPVTLRGRDLSLMISESREEEG
ncbi:MAG: type II toxin-antitoxin system prevent-host-death family antitoxin [Thermodesulfobacteriota bacterium]|nr:type II toxin-antitoxin system prevent-host-death family antitoxin [Thermodesulfobacteriota bacterium]